MLCWGSRLASLNLQGRIKLKSLLIHWVQLLEALVKPLCLKSLKYGLIALIIYFDSVNER